MRFASLLLLSACNGGDDLARSVLREMVAQVCATGRPGQDNYSALVDSCADMDVTRMWPP